MSSDLSNFELVNAQFEKIWSYGSESFAIAKQYIEDLEGYIEPTIETTVPSIEITPPGSIAIDPTIGAEIPDQPEESDYPLIPDAPSVSEHEFPEEPAFTLPSPPTLTDIVIPDFIEGTIAPITATLPVIDFSVPSVGDIQPGALNYDSLMAVIRDKLSSNITDGGTMLNPQVEADIWNRDRERREQALQDAIADASAVWAKLGWDMPDGLLAGTITAIHKEYMNKDLDASREISVKQADLEQQGLFKSLELGVSLEQVILMAENEYAKRVLEASKTTAEVTIEIYKARVTQYNAMLEAYKADVLAYKSSIEAEVARAEVFKSKVTALGIIAQVDESKIKIYTSHIAAIQQLVDLYKTKVQAVATMYEAENQKIIRYKAQIDAYVAAIEGVTKKYATSVEGFKAYVAAWATSAESQVKVKDLNMRGEIATLEATMKAWEVQMKVLHENTSLKLEALKAVAQTSSNLAAGALSAAHSNASAGMSSSSQTATQHIYSY